MKKWYVLFYLTISIIFVTGETFALDDQTAGISGNEFEKTVLTLGSKSRKDIKEAIEELSRFNNKKALPALQALANRLLRVDDKGNIFILSEDEDTVQNVLTGEHLSIESLKLKIPRINNSVRRILTPVIAQLHLQSADSQVRLKAAQKLSSNLHPESVDIIRKHLDQEENEDVQKFLHLALAEIDLKSDDISRRIEALVRIGKSGELKFQSLLKKLLEKDEEGVFLELDEGVRKAAQKALSSIKSKQFIITQTGNFFYGLSLGSILLLAALGLAVTFGLMGVINMAHGEMLMLGAYCTYVIQNLFQTYCPHFFDWYLLAAVPVAFMIPALIGVIMERTIIRYLYKRPLETLLATWGVSLILIQTIRLIFGAQNVEVANPSWLSGGMEIMPGLVLTYGRVAIILFAVFVVSAVWVILQHTRLGLQVRAVTQNRSMAACLGIATSKIDMWTFGLGSGVAGLGGVALSQITNVGPELGQLYIVDSFMVVVLGGVGKIAGTIFGAFGLGIVNKFLEPLSGAVLGKIWILIFVILFIQKRPQGIFAIKGRGEDNE